MFYVTVAEGTIQISCFFVMNMIEEDGLIDRYPAINGENGEEDLFGLYLKSMVGNSGKKENKDNSQQKAKFPLHIS